MHRQGRDSYLILGTCITTIIIGLVGSISGRYFGLVLLGSAEWGNVGEWVSGLGAFAAAWVAVRSVAAQHRFQTQETVYSRLLLSLERAHNQLLSPTTTASDLGSLGTRISAERSLADRAGCARAAEAYAELEEIWNEVVTTRPGYTERSRLAERVGQVRV